MKITLMIVVCSVAIFLAGCASPDSHIKMMEVASCPSDTPDKVLSEIARVLDNAHIECGIALGGPVGKPVRYEIGVPIDKRAEAASLLKQYTATHQYEIEIYYR